MTTTYRIEVRPTGETFTVRAVTVEEAASKAARRMYGWRATAHRATGTAGLSGIFGAYQFDRQLQAENQIGSEFAVHEE